jgi:hypothetical protein
VRQAKYWRCLRGLSEAAVFNPYSTPYALGSSAAVRQPSLDADELSPRHLAKKLRPSLGGDIPGGSSAAPETPKAMRGVQTTLSLVF